jgi:extracellular elastinolytic metalloproteinase
MKTLFTNRRGILLTFLSLFICCAAYAQDPLQLALEHLSANKEKYNLSSADISDYSITDQYVSKNSGITHIYLRQRHKGIEVEGATININIGPNGEVINMGSRFIPNLKAAVRGGAAAQTPVQAVEAAARSLNLPVAKALKVQEEKAGRGNGREVLVSKGNISRQAIPVKMMYQPMEDGTVKLAWVVSIYEQDAQHYWNIAIDAANGSVLKTEDQVIHDVWEGTPIVTDAPKSGTTQASASSVAKNSGLQVPYSPEYNQTSAAAGSGTYRVLDVPFETPNHGERSLVTGKENPAASPLGWHNDGALSYTITRGNNVFAYEDRSGANAGTSPDGGAELVFDFPLDLSQQPATYVEAATTNLFYWNNLMHDVFYQYGFDEVSGNFQHTNLTGEGEGLDAVSAEAQDGGGTNNANFLTLQDGVPGRMQMYLWTSALPADLLFVDAPASIAGAYVGIEAAFGEPLNETGVSGSIILADPANGCSGTPSLPEGAVPVPFNNQEEINGNIALIDRGECTFVEKALNAQASGATAVIVVNNIPGADPISMGGGESGALIVIPAIMISKEDGDKLKAELANGVNGSLKREGGVPPLRDGDLDNGIIAHEYGHGISIRLTGGPSTQCLSGAEQGGEGWSDYFALFMTMQEGDIAEMRRGIGTYVRSEGTDGNGIRPAPYSTDMSVNNYTYGNVSNPEISVPHGVGFIWATMLWDMTWNLIDEYGYDPDIYNGTGGNNIALQLIIDGLKLQPCSPGFIDARDAILAADQLHNGGANQCYIWRAFAKRGLGFSASQGSQNDLTDGVEAFDLPPSCEPNMAINLKANPSPVEDGSELTYTISVRNDTKGSLAGVQITDTLPTNTSFVSATDGSLKKGIVTFKPVKLKEGETIERHFTVQVSFGQGTKVYFTDDMENGGANWTTFHDVGVDDWVLSTANPHSGSTSWFAVDPNTYSNQSLILQSPVLLGENSLLRFWHDFATEDAFDGGVVEITTNGGLTWEDLGDKMIQNGYNGEIPLENASTVSGPAFTGGSGGYIQTIVDLSAYSGQQVQIRFRMGSDVLTAATGWYVDDVDIVSNPTSLLNTATVDSKHGGLKSTTIETLVLESSATVAGTGTLSADAESEAVSLNFSGENLQSAEYVLERSTDNQEFVAIASMMLMEEEADQFRYEDREVTAGAIYYYRVRKASDINAKAVAVEVKVPNPALAVGVYPNPASTQLNLRFPPQLSEAVSIRITNTAGRLVQTESLDVQESNGKAELDVSRLQPGIYFILISTGSELTTEKIIIE